MENLLYNINLSELPQTLMLGRIRQPLGWRNTGRNAPANMLILVTNGSISFCECGETKNLTPGDCLLLPEGKFYTAACREEACEYIFIHFSTIRPIQAIPQESAAKFMGDLIAQQTAFRGKYPYSLPPTAYDGVFLRPKTSLGQKEDAAMLLIVKCEGYRFETGINRKLKTDLCLAELLLLLSVQQVEGLSAPSSIPPALYKLLTLIQMNYSRALSLQELSDTFNLSKQYIIRLFKQHLGCTVTEYINSIKLYHSLELLKYSTLTVGKVAEALGYSSTYYFCRLFKKTYHMTPTEYMKSEMDSGLPGGALRKK
ncbi:MAG: AraC family transcriptional regulator [Bacillota bacterium]|nr:AraC family transcriptional regulator [Bacillota bacterium]